MSNPAITDEIAALFDAPAASSAGLKEALAGILASIGSEGPRDPAAVRAFFTHLARHLGGSGAPITEASIASVRAPDLWLAFRCASNDEAAMREFHARYREDIRRALAGVRVVGMDVEDLAQELARRMFVGEEPKIAEYSGRGDLRAWVRIVATRFSLDMARSKKNTADTPTDTTRFDAITSGAAALGSSSLGDAPDQAYFRRLYRKEVASAIELGLRELDAEERNALREHYARGLSVDQMAAVHGIHRATAARRVQRARESLVASVKRILDERHGLRGRELVSVMGLVRSQLHLTMDRVLATK